jgi:uncharacterized protein DUF4231
VTDESALDIATRQLAWCRANAKSGRLGYDGLELLVLGVSLLVTVAGTLAWDAAVPAIVGAVLVLLAGVRAIFQWRERWVGSAMAQTGLATAIDFYNQRLSPYDGVDRDEQLIRRACEIRIRETAAWESRRSSPPRLTPEGYKGAD